MSILGMLDIDMLDMRAHPRQWASTATDRRRFRPASHRRAA